MSINDNASLDTSRMGGGGGGGGRGPVIAGGGGVVGRAHDRRRGSGTPKALRAVE